MPEGRMLKKAICKSRKMAELDSDSARLLYVIMLPYLDIEGRLEADPYLIKGRIVPRLKDWDLPKIETCLMELVKCKMILLYQNDGDRYLQFTKFKDHQKLYPSKESSSKIPKPPKKNDANLEENQEDGLITPDKLLRTPDKLPASKVKKSKEKQSKEKKILLSNEIFSYWQKTMNLSRSKFTDGRKQKIKTRLDEGYTINDIKKAIDGCRASIYHMGENDNNTIYNDLTLICRTGEKLEWFIQKTKIAPTEESEKYPYDSSKLDYSILDEDD